MFIITVLRNVILIPCWYSFQRQFINMDNNQHHRLTSLLVSMRSDLLPQPKQSYTDVFDSSTSSDSDDEDDKVAATGTDYIFCSFY